MSTAAPEAGRKDSKQPRQAVSEQQVHELFDSITGTGEDSHNVITPEDFKAALGEYGLPVTAEYIRELFKQYDGNGNGEVDFAEFRAFVLAKERRVQHAFKKLDPDGSGRISIDDLEHAASTTFMALSEEDAKKMIGLLDKDEDGTVTLDEFRRFADLLPESQINDDDILFSWVDSADWAEGVVRCMEYRLCLTPPKQPVHRLIAGGVAGALSRGSVAPLERLRTLMMADSQNRRLSETLYKMWTHKETGGIRGLFKGNLATMVKVIPQSAVQFAVYDTVQDLMVEQAKLAGAVQTSDSGSLTTGQHLLAGSLAGAASSAVVYPFELLRTHMAMGSANYGSAIKDIWQSRGVGGLYQGWQAGMLSTVTANAVGFASYEVGLKRYREVVEGRAPTPLERGCIAGGAACFVMATVMPFEVVQRRLQVQGREGHPLLYGTTWEAVRRIFAAEGITAFWRGSLPTFMKVAPSILVVRFVYESLIQTWGTGGIHRYRQGQPVADDADFSDQSS